VFKVVALVRSSGHVAPEAFGAAWRDQVLADVEATPAALRPRRLALCTVRPGRRPPRFDGASLAWFDDLGAATAPAAAPPRGDDDLIDAGSSHRILVEERPVRGQDWLDARWHDAGSARSLVLLVLLERVPALTRAEFRDYWWDHHRPFTDEVIPLAIQPRAYVHNYPLADQASPWDGIGEMYEDSLDVPRDRSRWLETPEAVAVVADEGRFIDRPTRCVLVADHEVVVAG
jgi:hypothetical protein